MLERSEVADVVARPQRDAAGVAEVEHRLQLGVDVEQHVRLQDQIGVIGRVAVRDGEDELPAGDPLVGQPHAQRVQLAHGPAVDLRVGGHPSAGRSHVPHGLDRAFEAAGGAQRVVGVRQAVDRQRHDLDPGLDQRLGAPPGEGQAAGGERRLHPALADAPDHQQHVVAQVRLAADEGHLAHAEVGQLVHQPQRFLGRQLVGPGLGRPRAAGAAALVAGEGELPDRVGGARSLGVGLGQEPPALGLGQLVDDGEPAPHVLEAHSLRIPPARRSAPSEPEPVLAQLPRHPREPGG